MRCAASPRTRRACTGDDGSGDGFPAAVKTHRSSLTSQPERIVFTMNATHALNIAIRSLAHKGTRVLVSGYEQSSVTRPLAQLGADIAVASSAFLLTGMGYSRPSGIKSRRRALMVCTHVSNVFGFILPVYEIADMCARGSAVHSTPHSRLVLEVDYQALGAAFIAMPGHKALFGPQGTGDTHLRRRGRTAAQRRLQGRTAYRSLCPSTCPTGWRPGRLMSPVSRDSQRNKLCALTRFKNRSRRMRDACWILCLTDSTAALDLKFSAVRRGRRAVYCRSGRFARRLGLLRSSSPSAAYVCAAGCTARRMHTGAPGRSRPGR